MKKEFTGIIVHPDFQNHGIGKRLVLEIEKEFPDAKQFLLCTGYKSFKNIKLFLARLSYPVIFVLAV